MTRYQITVALTFIFVTISTATEQSGGRVLPLSFEPNAGQADSPVNFPAHALTHAEEIEARLDPKLHSRYDRGVKWPRRRSSMLLP